VSFVEIGTILVGLVVGYWIVSVLFDWLAARRRAGFGQVESNSTNAAADTPGAARRPSPPPLNLPGNDDPANWPQVLEVASTSSPQQITAAYRRKIAQYHPDKVAQMGAEIRGLAELRSRQINAAYDFAMKVRHRSDL
jgi:DnaJ-domain-containing protein 1